MTTTEELAQLFSYGTLQDEAIQLATFGRKLDGAPDTLRGYRLTQLRMQNADATSSEDEYYLNAQLTGSDSDLITGIRFQVTESELEQADIYEETAAYRRISVQLDSGIESWVYVGIASEES